MAKNPKNNDACNVLAAAISAMARNGGAVVIRDRRALSAAYNALMQEPPPCPDDCLWGKMERTQKCNCCARNRRLRDLYESG